MRLRLRFAILAAALAAPAASADPGPHIAWDDCTSYGQSFKTFACDTNVGSRTAVGSFSAPFQIDQFNQLNVVLRVYATGPTLPAWWELKGAGQCRSLGAIPSADFTVGPKNCLDFWAGQAAGGMTDMDLNFYGPGTARIRLLFAIPSTTPVAANVETYAFKLVINSIRTVGPARCTGCDQPVGIVVDNYVLLQPAGAPGGNVTLSNTGQFGSIGWQCPGEFSCGDGPWGTCAWLPDCATPTGRSTWGAVKSLYR